MHSEGLRVAQAFPVRCCIVDSLYFYEKLGTNVPNSLHVCIYNDGERQCFTVHVLVCWQLFSGYRHTFWPVSRRLRKPHWICPLSHHHACNVRDMSNELTYNIVWYKIESNNIKDWVPALLNSQGVSKFWANYNKKKTNKICLKSHGVYVVCGKIVSKHLKQNFLISPSQ